MSFASGYGLKGKRAARPKGASRGFKPTQNYASTTRRMNPRLQAARQQARMRGVVRAAPEKRGLDTDIDLGSMITTTNTNANIFVLNLIRTGNGPENRNGKKVNLESVRLKGNMNYSVTAGATSFIGVNVRMCLVWDKQPSGVLPVFSTIFGRTVQDGTESSEYLDPPRYDNQDRFKVLLDKQFEFTPSAVATGAGIQTVVFDEFVRLDGLTTIFSGASTPMTIADISTGALYLVFRANNNSANGTCFNEAGIARLRYRDP